MECFLLVQDGNKKLPMDSCVPPDYVIEESEYFVNSFHYPSVVVPRTGINLTTHQKRQLEGLYPPFQCSDHGGVDIYVDVRHHIFYFTHS